MVGTCTAYVGSLFVTQHMWTCMHTFEHTCHTHAPITRILYIFFLTLLPFAVKTCAKVTVSNASVLPDQAQFDYGTSATYTCSTGYELASGDLVRTCQDDKSWDGTEPVCQSRYRVYKIIYNGTFCRHSGTMDSRERLVYMSQFGQFQHQRSLSD